MISENDITNLQKEAKRILELSSIEKSEEYRLAHTLYSNAMTQSGTLPELDTNDLTFVYFTRTNLFLDDTTLSRNRRLLAYGNTVDDSIHKFIRGTLSPYEVDKNGLTSNLLNHNTPFIPLLSNTLATLSGWPDEVLKSWESPAGNYGEQWGHVNSVIQFKGTFELNATFYNIIEDPVAKLFELYTIYSSEVRFGNMIPWVGSILSRETDYFMGIYVIVTNANFKIKHIAKTRGYPVANPKGIYMDYNRKETKRGKFNMYNTRFKCFGAEYDDPAILQDFNHSMMAFNKEIYSTVTQGTKDMVEVSPRFKKMFHQEGYPFIDLKYNTLEFLISKSQYEVKTKPLNEEENNDGN